MKKTSRNKSVKKILIIILALMISSFIGYRFALAQSGNALKSVVEPGSMVTESSYIIFTDGTTVYARNGTTGEIEFSGTNASQVINNALGNLKSGGNIVIENGAYLLDSSINIKSNRVGLYGDGTVTLKAISGCVNMININGSNYANRVQDVSLNNLIFDGNYTAISGVWMNNTWGVGMQNVQMYNMSYALFLDTYSQDFMGTLLNIGDVWTGVLINGTADQGFHLKDSWIGSTTQGGFNMTNGQENTQITLENVFFTDANQNTISINSLDGQPAMNFDVENCWFEDTNYNGIYMMNVYNAKITHSWFYHSTATGHEHVYLYNAYGTDLEDNYFDVTGATYPSVTLSGVTSYGTFRNNRFISSGAGFSYYVQQYCAYNDIYQSESNDATFVYAPGSTQQNNFFGKIFQNSGSWNGSSPIYVAHGLAGTPTIVSISVNGTQPYSTSWTANSTHITIYHNGTGSLSGSWEAQYNP